jgi:hypothetical protein
MIPLSNIRQLWQFETVSALRTMLLLLLTPFQGQSGMISILTLKGKSPKMANWLLTPLPSSPLDTEPNQPMLV